MKKGKEIELDLDNKYSIHSGAIDNKNAKTIYLNISSWGKPQHELELNYEKIIRGLRKNICSHLYKTLPENNFKIENTIVDLDMRSSGVNYNKKSFMSCEITLFQKVCNPINSEITMNYVKDISTSLISDVLDKNEYFEFSKKK